MSGAFQTSRDIFNNPIWKNIVEFRLFFLIYGNAIFSEEGVRLADDLTLKRGEWCRSTRKLQEDLTYIENRQIKTYSTSVINRCIKSLVSSQRICTRIHDLGTVFTVLNYEQYQGFGGYRNENLERNLEQYQNSVGTIEEQHRNNNKNVKNVNKEKNEKNKETKKEYADYVFLTETEYGKLTELLGDDERDRYFLRFASWISGRPKKEQQNRSAYLSILNWHRDRDNKQIPFPQRNQSKYERTKSKLDQMLMEAEGRANGTGGYYQTGTDS